MVNITTSTQHEGGEAYTTEILRFDGVDLSFGGGRMAISNICLGIPEGRFVSIIGPSGCGKSTILNLAAGFMPPTRGSVLFKGRPLEGINRGAAYVPQDSSLLPWLRVKDNIGLPLRLRKMENQARQERVNDWLHLVGLQGFGEHFPGQLSGGMQKRCSIARALIYEPDIVLMDEPFGPLDALTRLKVQKVLMQIFESELRTIVFVTHDLIEAVGLSDVVIVMSGNPGHVIARVEIPIPRPRDLATITDLPAFKETHQQLRSYFDI